MWKWFDGKYLNRFLVAGLVLYVVFRSGFYAFAQNQIYASDEMESNLDEQTTQDPESSDSEVNSAQTNGQESSPVAQTSKEVIKTQQGNSL